MNDLRDDLNAARLPTMAIRRTRDGLLDDVVVKDVEMFHAERMSDGILWMACYFANGERVTFNLRAQAQDTLVFDAGEMPNSWRDWDFARTKPGTDMNQPKVVA